jgi:carbon starvation protein
MRTKLPADRYERLFQPKEFDTFEKEICTPGEHLGGRTAGAVTLAVGMAKIFSDLPGMKQLIAYWYRFVVMFEALFILTLLETGTRVARFIFQDTVTQLLPRRYADHPPTWLKWSLNIGISVLVCFLWGGLLYTGNIDRLWRMMGIANQLLAAIALAVGTSYLLIHAPKRIYALCTALPLVFVVITVFTAGIESIHQWWHELAAWNMQLADPATSAAMVEEIGMKIFSIKLTCAMAAVMLGLSALIVIDGLRQWYHLLTNRRCTCETNTSTTESA